MEKVVQFLERYVQWLVLGIAALYVGYTIYSYVVQSPLTVTVGAGADHKEAGPGSIDEFTVAHEVKPLEDDLKKTVDNAPQVTDVRGVFDNALNMNGAGVQLADLSCPFDAPSARIKGMTETPVGPSGLVAKLPTDLPPAVFVNSSADRTVIKDGGKGVDMAYIAVRFKIESRRLKDALANSYRGSQVPPGAWNTLEIVEVQLLREKQNADQSWSAPEVIKPPAVNDIPPFPSEGTSQEVKLTYNQWVVDHQGTLLHPQFYPLAEGAPSLQLPPTTSTPAGAAPGAAAAAPAGAGAAPAPAPAPQGAVAAEPVDPNGDIDIVQFDTGIKEDAKYRYSLRYKLYNPLFTKKALAEPSVAQVLGVAGPDPTAVKDPQFVVWSGDVQVPPSAFVFVTKVNVHAGGNASYEVFEWRGGRWLQKENAKGITPGDAVAGTSGPTRWTLVDVRRDPKAGGVAYALLMDETGNLERHDDSDLQSPNLARLRGLAGVGPAAAASAGAGNPVPN